MCGRELLRLDGRGTSAGTLKLACKANLPKDKWVIEERRKTTAASCTGEQGVALDV